jgi:hypothetical protein
MLQMCSSCHISSDLEHWSLVATSASNAERSGVLRNHGLSRGGEDGDDRGTLGAAAARAHRAQQIGSIRELLRLLSGHRRVVYIFQVGHDDHARRPLFMAALVWLAP